LNGWAVELFWAIDPVCLSGESNRRFATLLWESMVAGEPDQEINKNFPIKNAQAAVMYGSGISNYLSEVWSADFQSAVPQGCQPAER